MDVEEFYACSFEDILNQAKTTWWPFLNFFQLCVGDSNPFRSIARVLKHWIEKNECAHPNI